METAQGNPPFFPIFLGFSQLIIISFFLTFAPSPFDSSPPLKIFSFPFKPTSNSLTIAKSPAESNSPVHPDLIFRDLS